MQVETATDDVFREWNAADFAAAKRMKIGGADSGAQMVLFGEQPPPAVQQAPPAQQVPPAVQQIAPVDFGLHTRDEDDHHLRDYQRLCKESIASTLRETERALMVMPTGCGKTETFLHFAVDWPGLSYQKGATVLVLAHREELIWQPFERWYGITGVYPDVVMQQNTRQARRRNYGVTNLVVASKDTLYRGDRLQREFPDPKEVGLIIIDEAHHAVQQNATYRKIIDYFQQGNPELRILGATATPDRADEQALGQTFYQVAFDYPLFDAAGGPSAIGDGWLVNIVNEIVTVQGLDLSVVGTRGGDYIDSQLESVIAEEKVLHRLTAPLMELNGRRQCLTFLPGVGAAVRATEILNRPAMGSAYCVVSRIPGSEDADGVGFDESGVVLARDKDARKGVLKRFANREFPYLVNVGCFTEGFDSPSIEIVSMGRPTKSRALYAQMVGRGTRCLPNVIEGKGPDGKWWRLTDKKSRLDAIGGSAKPHLTVFDFCGVSGHNLILTACDLLGGSYPEEVVAKAKRSEKTGGPEPVSESLKKAMSIWLAEREERKRIASQARFKTTAASPWQQSFDMLGIVAAREPGWHAGRRPTPGMIHALGRFRVSDAVIAKLTFWGAKQMLDNLTKRASLKLATYKQAQMLEKYGCPYTNCSFGQASAIIDKIARAGWKKLDSYPPNDTVE
jgi:superfamily II DNA or RNA helicase